MQPRYNQPQPTLPPMQPYPYSQQQFNIRQPQQPQQYYQQPVQRHFNPYDGSSDELSAASIPMPQQAAPIPLHPQPKPRREYKSFPQEQQVSPPRHNLEKIDALSLLPALAEEYFTGAYQIGFAAAQRADAATINQYQKLVATGLGCLEVALGRGRYEPRMEAAIRLRYASVLLEETDNTTEAETALSKGITLCEQNGLFDIKYTMQVLLAKLLYNRSSKAAMIALDANIQEVEAYQHHSWIYIFRFLRSTLSLQTGRLADFHAAITNLQATVKLASRRGDHAVLTLASLVEALAHLRNPGPDAAENLNRALATAQQYQLSPDCDIAPLQVFAHILRLTSSLSHDSTEKTFEKLKAFQLKINEAASDSGWRMRSDAITVPLHRGNGDAQISSQYTKGLVNVSDDGNESLVFSFISKQDAYLIGYLLAGAARIYVKGDDNTPVKYLKEGLAKCLDPKTFKQSGPVTVINEILSKRRTMACYFHCFLAFRSIFTTDWKSAKDALDGLELGIKDLQQSVEPTLVLLAPYLRAMYLQGTGDIMQALRIYEGGQFALPETNAGPQTPVGQMQRDIAIVAAMNALLIRNSDPQSDVAANTALINKLQSLCESHPHADIQTAYSIVRTVIRTDPPTSQLSTKTYMRNALNGAKKRGNFHLVCITLNVMCTRFFANIIGEQSIKSAMAAREQSAKSGNKLWMSASTGMLAHTFEIEGRGAEASTNLNEAVRLANVALQVPQ